MASDTSSNNSPFEWLSGGLFFGSGAKKGGLESIDSCKDVTVLIKGMDENLKQIILTRDSTAAAAAAAASKADDATTTAATADAATDDKDTTNNTDTEPTPQSLLAARSQRVRFLLYEERRMTSSQDPRRNSLPQVASATVTCLTNEAQNHLIPRLLDHLGSLPFESRKHVASIFSYLCICGLEGQDAALYQPVMQAFGQYILSRYDEIISSLVDGHDVARHNGQADCALHCGSMIRSCLRQVALYQQFTITTERTQRYVFPFLENYVNVPNFDVASDAMETLRVILTGGGDNKHADEPTQQAMAEISANFLTRDYEAIWIQRFNPLLLSESANYMTRRMALQILSTVLLTRSNYAVMIQYVASRQNLILVMKLLRDNSPHITLDAFHVFKVFVANPNKPPDIVKILADNSVKLCRYLETLHKDKEDADPQFRDEKALIIQTIAGLQQQQQQQEQQQQQ